MAALVLTKSNRLIPHTQTWICHLLKRDQRRAGVACVGLDVYVDQESGWNIAWLSIFLEFPTVIIWCVNGKLTQGSVAKSHTVNFGYKGHLGKYCILYQISLITEEVGVFHYWDQEMRLLYPVVSQSEVWAQCNWVESREDYYWQPMDSIRNVMVFVVKIRAFACSASVKLNKPILRSNESDRQWNLHTILSTSW